MAAVTDTIGTSSRDFSTITLWAASLSAHSGDDVTGECYDDSAFDEDVVFTDGTPTSARLTAAAGEQHDGTEGSGVRIVRTAGSSILFWIAGNSNTVEYLEIDANGQAVGILIRGSTNSPTIQRLLIHGIVHASANTEALQPGGCEYHNNFIFDILSTHAGGGWSIGIRDSTNSGATSKCLNNTVHDIVNNGGNGPATGVLFSDSAVKTVKNTIATDVGGTGGSKNCFSPAAPSNATAGFNLSSDTTAADDGVTGNVLISKASSNQFVSNSSPYDLHLKTGADAIDAGSDLGTTPSGVESDIDGRDRDAEADTWDMGADELVAAGVSVAASPIAAAWSAVAPSISLGSPASPVAASWSPIVPTVTLGSSVAAAPLAATWSAVEPNTALTTIAIAVGAAWSSVEPNTALATTAVAVAASWSAVEPATGLALAATPLAASWSAVEPRLALALSTVAVAASWTPIVPGITTGSAVAAAPVAATWTAVEPATALAISSLAIAASWSAALPITSLAVGVAPLSAAWSSVAPTSTLSIVVTPQAASWSIVTPGITLSGAIDGVLSATLDVGGPLDATLTIDPVLSATLHVGGLLDATLEIL